MAINIAIDGPAGAGKSTIAKKVAKDLGFIYVDTGAMYRAMAYFFLSEGVDINDEPKVCEKAKEADIKIKYIDGEQKVFLNGNDVTPFLRQEKTGDAASVTSQYGPVREKLVSLQKEMAKTTDLVMDGRDIGTVVLPEAKLKVYLTASVEVRAKRRFDELVVKGETPDIEAIKTTIRDRDYRDMNRENSPLKQAEDAILVDSSDMTIDEVCEKIKDLLK